MLGMLFMRMLGPLIDRWAAGGRSPEEMSPEERQNAGRAKQQARQAQKTLRMARRIGRF